MLCPVTLYGNVCACMCTYSHCHTVPIDLSRMLSMQMHSCRLQFVLAPSLFRHVCAHSRPYSAHALHSPLLGNCTPGQQQQHCPDGIQHSLQCALITELPFLPPYYTLVGPNGCSFGKCCSAISLTLIRPSLFLSPPKQIL